MTVDNVHEIISLKPSKWLKKKIEFNNKKRNKAAIDFANDFHKLPENSFYGKTMENVRNQIKAEFV